jgi:hypothetical protein
MHYRLMVTLSKHFAETSAEARSHVYHTLIDDETFVGGGRFSSGFCDWFVIGGRWSGELSRLTWAKDAFAEIQKLEHSEGIQIWGVHYGDLDKQKQQRKLAKKIEKLYQRAMPAEYKGKGLIYERDTYVDQGYEDDAMLVDQTLYDALLAEYDGDDMVEDEWRLAFVDLDYEAVSPDFIGEKWLVVLDAHT